MSFKIVDCVIIHRNKDVQIANFQDKCSILTL